MQKHCGVQFSNYFRKRGPVDKIYEKIASLLKQSPQKHLSISYIQSHFPLPMCGTLSWWGDLRALMTLEAISAGTAVPGRFNLAEKVPGERSDELQLLALQVGGWAKGNNPSL